MRIRKEHRKLPGGIINHSWTVRLLAAFAFAALAIGAISCAVNKATGERQLNLISESREIELGRDAHQSILASMGVYPDSAVQRYVRELGLAMSARCERPNLPWTFTVVDDPTVNAFALPGGFIYVTRGIMAHMSNEAELCGVLGHEIGHVTAQHSVNQMSKQQLAGLGLGVTTIVKPELQKYSDLLSTGLGLLFLKFGRDDEKQADYLGLRYMSRIERDPREMEDVMTMLDAVTQAHGGGRVPEWLSTHPDPGNRRQLIKDNLDTMTTDFAGYAVNRDGYLNILNKMKYGTDPRQGYFQGSDFYHPDLKFQISFPDGWQTANQVAAVIAGSPDENAIVQVTFAQASSADAAAAQFFGQPGISAANVSAGNINNLHAAWGDFRATTENGVLAGVAYFYDHGGKVYQVLAFGTSSGWQSHEPAGRAAARSFSKLTDQGKLNVEAWKLDIINIGTPTTLQELKERYNSPASLQELALINRIAENASIGRGERIKMIVGKPLP